MFIVYSTSIHYSATLRNAFGRDTPRTCAFPALPLRTFILTLTFSPQGAFPPSAAAAGAPFTLFTGTAVPSCALVGLTTSGRFPAPTPRAVRRGVAAMFVLSTRTGREIASERRFIRPRGAGAGAGAGAGVGVGAGLVLVPRGVA